MQIAAGFKEIGPPGDRVALLLGNRNEPCCAVWRSPSRPCQRDAEYRQQKPEIAYVLNDCGAKLLIYEDDMADRLPDAAELPGLLHRVSISPTDGALAFQDLVATEIPPSPAPVDEQDTAMILYTSGTTGKRRRNAGALQSDPLGNGVEACLELTGTDVRIAAVPLAHVTGIAANIMAMARCAGALIIVPEFKAAEYLKIASRERATQTVMVPAMYNLSLAAGRFRLL
jgi:acyl-CoA synthetase (AMP-forming)/AMP-acid ligase II